MKPHANAYGESILNTIQRINDVEKFPLLKGEGQGEVITAGLSMVYQYTQDLKINARGLRRKQTDTERLLWSKLRNNQLGIKFYRQFPLQGYILDFYCSSANTSIELDGSQHQNESILKYDQHRTRILKEKGICQLRFWDTDVIQNTAGVLELIRKTVIERKDIHLR